MKLKHQVQTKLMKTTKTHLGMHMIVESVIKICGKSLVDDNERNVHKPSHIRISCNDEDIKFLEEQSPLIFFTRKNLKKKIKMTKV
jgi:hypothetical protein